MIRFAISDERLVDIASGRSFSFVPDEEVQRMAKELLALRKALSEPVGLFTECKSMGYSHFIQTNVGEPLYRHPKP